MNPQMLSVPLLCACVCVCVYMYKCLGNSSKQSVLENAKQKCEWECEYESDCECE